MHTKKILAIFAHPDDEAFGTGGSLARYAGQGHLVYLVCATRGEVGEISDPSLATHETLGQVREGELRCSAETMGIKELIFLGYRDSGMIDTPENLDPRAYINAQAQEVIRTLVELIRRIKPDIVITFEPNGGYGHPDHIAIHRHTLESFFRAADPAFLPGVGSVWQANHLFYTAIPRSFFIELRSLLQQNGSETDDLDSLMRNENGWPDEQVNVIVDVSDTVEAKWEALNCHRTQFGPGNLFRRLPDQQIKHLLSKEYFAQAWPEPSSGFLTNDLV